LDTSGYPPYDPGYAITPSDSLAGDFFFFFPFDATGEENGKLVELGLGGIASLTVTDDQADLDFITDWIGVYEIGSGDSGSADFYDTDDLSLNGDYVDFSITLSDPQVPDCMATIWPLMASLCACFWLYGRRQKPFRSALLRSC
jgi:hypothetical protein